MSVLLGWLIYAALAALVVFGIPKAALVLSGDKTISYWEAVRFTIKLLVFCSALIGAFIGLIFLGMWAGDLVSGRA